MIHYYIFTNHGPLSGKIHKTCEYINHTKSLEVDMMFTGESDVLFNDIWDGLHKQIFTII